MKRNIRMMKVLLFIFMWTTAIDSFGQNLFSLIGDRVASLKILCKQSVALRI